MKSLTRVFWFGVAFAFTGHAVPKASAAMALDPASAAVIFAEPGTTVPLQFNWTSDNATSVGALGLWFVGEIANNALSITLVSPIGWGTAITNSGSLDAKRGSTFVLSPSTTFSSLTATVNITISAAAPPNSTYTVDFFVDTVDFASSLWRSASTSGTLNLYDNVPAAPTLRQAFAVTVVPEPSAIGLALLGLGTVFTLRRRSR
jgi:PEP-CTERM motif